MEASKYLISLFFTGLLRQPMAASQRRMIDSLCTTVVNSSPKSGVMANLAGIYTDTLSTFAFRIHITGKQNYLTNINNTNKIRTLLLAGVRAAVLWRQMGGNRWQLLLSRKQIVDDAKLLLNEIHQLPLQTEEPHH